MKPLNGRCLVVQLLMIATMLNAASIMDPQVAAKEQRSKGCVYNGEVYKEGATVATKEQCLNCVCRRGALECQRQICPHLGHSSPPPPGCIYVERKGACCPKLHCPEKELQTRVERKDPSRKLSTWKARSDLRRILTKQLSRSVSDKSGCVESGTVYADGSAMMTSSSCEYCFCLRGKQLCVKPRCSPPMAGCAPRYRALACCPTHYHCPAEAAATNETTADERLHSPESLLHDAQYSGDLLVDDPSLAMRSNDRLIDSPHHESGIKRLRSKRQDTEEDPSEVVTTEHSDSLLDNTETNPAPDSATATEELENSTNDNKDEQKDSPVITSTDLQDRPIQLSIHSTDSGEPNSTAVVGEDQSKSTKTADSGKILDALLSLKGKPKETKTETKTTITVSTSSSSSTSSRTSSSIAATSADPAATTTTTKTPAEETTVAKTEASSTESGKAEEFSPVSPAGDFTPIKSADDETKAQDYEDYDYRNMELPPSLPNLKIIPFVAADAVDPALQTPQEDERLSLGLAEQRSPASRPTETTSETSSIRPSPVFSSTEKSPLLAFTVTFPPRTSSTAAVERVTQPPPRVTQAPTPAPTPRKPQPVPGISAQRSSGGLLRIDGCNIYGVMYSVGRIIEELSGPCIECRCTDSGVQCTPLNC